MSKPGPDLVCPRCGRKLQTNGKVVWCVNPGGFRDDGAFHHQIYDRPCGYGLFTTVTVAQAAEVQDVTKEGKE